MAQHDYVIANGTGAAVRSDLNNALAAIVSQNSGATAPSTTYAYQWWADTTTGLLKLRNAANSGWITLFQLDGEWSTIALENGTAAAPSIYFKDSGTDTGFYSPGTDQVGISTGGTARLTIDSNGNVAIDTNTLYVDATNNRVGLGTSSPTTTLDVAGNARLHNSTSNTNRKLEIRSTQGYSSFIQFTEDNIADRWSLGIANGDGGFIFKTGADFTGTERLRITSAGNVGIGVTSPSGIFHAKAGTNANLVVDNNGAGGGALRISALNDAISSNTDFQLQGSKLFFVTGGSERARLDDSGRLLVGTSTATGSSAVQVLKTSGDAFLIRNGDTNYEGFLVQNSSGLVDLIAASGGATARPAMRFITSDSERMRIRADGQIVCTATYDNTTANAANVHIFSDKSLGRSTSSIRFKTDVETLQDSYADEILKCRPVWYRSLCKEDNQDWGYWGFIAEEVEQVDPRLCQYGLDEDGNQQVESVQYDRFVPHLLNLIKRQGEAIAELQAEVAALKGA